MPFHWFRACSPQAVVDSGVDGKQDAIDDGVDELKRDAEEHFPAASGFHDLPQDLLEHVFRHLEGSTRRNHFAVSV